MIGQALSIARNTFTESIRQPVFFILILASGLGQIANLLLSAYSMGYTEDMEVHGDDKLLLDMGLATVMVCGTLLAAFVSTSVLSREIENKTALTVISKPVGRPLFIIGKYLGVTASILVAMSIMLVFFLFAIRHEVMSTARDHVDGPVLLFSMLSVFIPIALAIWGNYFYEWIFTSAAIYMMIPATLLAYLAVMVISKDWAFQSPAESFKPQVMLASSCVVMSVMVLSAISVAASTRLGQVMTIVVCAGSLVLGLLSNHLLGSLAIQNTQIAVAKDVSFPDESDATLARAGDMAVITFTTEPRIDLQSQMSIFYGSDPSGVSIAVPAHNPFEGDLTRERDVYEPSTGAALVIEGIEPDSDLAYRIRNVGGLAVKRPPRVGDSFFAQRTVSNIPARVAWSIIPNIQSFWLVDAVTQGHDIPPRYVLMVAGYTITQTVTMLALAIFLFQKRDVG